MGHGYKCTASFCNNKSEKRYAAEGDDEPSEHEHSNMFGPLGEGMPGTEHDHTMTRKFIQSKTEESSELPEVDQEFLILKVPTFWEYFGYALCPGTTVFGPWVPYKDYLSIFNNPIWNPNWLLKIIFSVTLSLLFLTISTCWIPMFIPDMKMNQKWISAYRDAM